jgi:hypothetical protein
MVELSAGGAALSGTMGNDKSTTVDHRRIVFRTFFGAVIPA